MAAQNLKSKSEQLEIFVPLACGVFAFLLYEFTNAHGLYWGDAGEFIAVSKTLGIGHPYGHPLFWLFGRLSILLLPHAPAAAMNHLIAFISGSTCIVIARLVQNWIDRSFSAGNRTAIVFICTSIYATAASVWMEASFTEVYNFQAFFMALMIYFLDCFFYRRGPSSHLFAAAFFGGIAITLGMYAAFFIILPVFIILYRRLHTQVRVYHYIVSFFFCILGLSLWLYLPIRSGTEPIFQLHKINTLNSFFSYLTRKIYEGKGTAGPVAIPFTFLKSLQIVMKNIGISGFLILSAAAWHLLREKSDRNVIPYILTSCILILIFSVFLPLNLIYIQMVGMDVYFIPIFILWMPVLAVGMNRIFHFLRDRMRYILLGIVPLLIWSRWEHYDLSRDDRAEAFLHYLTSSLPQNAEIIALSDALIYPLIYTIYAERNPNNYNFLMHKHLDDPEKNWWAAYLGRKNVFVQMDALFYNTAKDTNAVQAGGLFLVSKHDSAAASILERGFNTLFPLDSLEQMVAHEIDRFFIGMMLTRRGIFWYNMFLKGNIEAGTTQEAYQKANLSFLTALLLNDSNLSGAQHAANLSISLIHSGNLDEAEKYARWALKINPLWLDGHRSLSNILKERRDYPNAVRQTLKAVKIAPENGELYLDLAQLYHIQGNPAEAKKSYEKGIRLGAKHREKLEVLLFSP
jgi:tetratricopeptide (TPR) repeat protein